MDDILKPIKLISKDKHKNTSKKPETVCIDGVHVYNAFDLFQHDREFFKGCITVRSIVDKKQLHNKDYLFAQHKNGEWTVRSEKIKKSKTLHHSRVGTK